MEKPPPSTDLRRDILDTARRLLVENSYKSLSMRKIAGAIGYSATSIYLYFKNKDALFQALVEEGMDRLYDDLEQAAQCPGDAAARVEALCRAYIGFGLSNPEYYELMFMVRTDHMQRFPPEKYRRARRNLHRMERALAEGREAGQLAVEDAAAATAAIWATLHGAISLLLARRVDVRIGREAFAEAAVAQVMQSLAPTACPAPDAGSVAAGR